MSSKKGKIKTNKAIAKRIKITKSWKVKHMKAGRNHLLTNKWKAPKKYKFGKILSEREQKKIEALVPYKLR